MDAVVYKEFGQNDLEWTRPLLKLGYQRIAAPPMHFFRPAFRDLQHYCAALRSEYRRQIKYSIRKLEKVGVEVSVLTEANDIITAYTPEVHRLYFQTRARSHHKFENLSVDFFHELAIRLAGQVDLVVLSTHTKIVAFGWTLRDGSTYHLLYLGVDYELNSEADLYFNLVYATLDRALRQGVSNIEVGFTANAFKAKLGCYSEPSYVFAKGLGLLMSRMVRYGANFLIAEEPAIPPFNIFRSGVEGGRDAASP
jgi:predicted N-acyltransferase